MVICHAVPAAVRGAGPSPRFILARKTIVMPSTPPPADRTKLAELAETPERQPDDARLSAAISAEHASPMRDEPPGGAEWAPEPGDDVFGACGHKIGEIVERHPDHIVVEMGFFNPSELYIPNDVIEGHHGDDVVLSVTKHEALHHGWDHDPLAEDSPGPPDDDL